MVRCKGKRLNLYVKNYLVFDLETTGINQNKDEIIEISGIKVRDNQVIEEFSTLVNPEIPIPFAATRVNGITDQMVKDAPLLSHALSDFLDFAGEDILVGHNIHTFDTNFIYDGALRELDKQVQNDYIDTLYLSRMCLPELKHHKLTDVAEHFAIKTEGAHRALNDCVMNQKCYEELGVIWEKNKSLVPRESNKSKGSSQTVVVCPNCGCLLMKRKGRFGEFLGCSGFPSCRYTAKI